MKALVLAILAILGLLGPASAQLPQTQCISTAAAGGTGDAITIPLLPCSETTTLLILTISASNATSAPTISVNGQTPHSILNFDGSALTGGFLSANQRRILTYNGTNWIVLSGVGGGGGGCVDATPSSVGCVQPDDVTITVNGSGIITAVTATSSTLGVVKPDNSTITISGGVLTAVSTAQPACSHTGNYGCINLENTWSKHQDPAVTTLTDGSAISVDGTGANLYQVTITGNSHTLGCPSPVRDGTYNTLIVQDGTGHTGFATNSCYKYPGGAAPSWSTAANARDMLSCTGYSALGILICNALINLQ